MLVGSMNDCVNTHSPVTLQLSAPPALPPLSDDSLLAFFDIYCTDTLSSILCISATQPFPV